VPTRAHRAVPPTARRNRNRHEAQKPAPTRTVTKPGEPDSLRLAGVLLANLDQVAEDLRIGSLVVISDNRIRLRRLPVKKPE
jgi:hypothetical protein